MKFKYDIEEEDPEEEYPEFPKGTHWLCIEFSNGVLLDLASETWKTKRENRQQYIPENNFTDPFNPSLEELTVFELQYGTLSKDEYLKWMNAVIKHNKDKEDEEQI